METYSVAHETWGYVVQRMDDISDRGLQLIIDQLESLIEKNPRDGDLIQALAFVEAELETRECLARVAGHS